jgi:UDP-glucuronate decarboxylase
MPGVPFYRQPWFLPIGALVGVIIWLQMNSTSPILTGAPGTMEGAGHAGVGVSEGPGLDERSIASLVNSQIDSRLVDIAKSMNLTTPSGGRFPPITVLPEHQKLRILVTGGAGFVGSHLVDRLMLAGHAVYVVDNYFTGRKANVEQWVGHPNFQIIIHDVVESIHLEVDRIYHLACPASPPHYQYNPIKTIKTSTEGTLNMLGLAKRVKARMLLTSTSEVYGDPEVHPQKESYWGNVNPIGPRACYDEGKRVAETMMYAYQSQAQVDVRVARIFNTFGPRMHPNDGRVVSNFIIQALQGKDITIYGDGSQTRSFQYVDDLVEGLIRLMEGSYTQPVNLGNPDEYTIQDFATIIKEITGSSSNIHNVEGTEDDPRKRKPDISLAKAELGWEPQVAVRDGLQNTINYFQKEIERAGGNIVPTGPDATKPRQVQSPYESKQQRLRKE